MLEFFRKIDSLGVFLSTFGKSPWIFSWNSFELPYLNCSFDQLAAAASLSKKLRENMYSAIMSILNNQITDLFVLSDAFDNDDTFDEAVETRETL